LFVSYCAVPCAAKKNDKRFGLTVPPNATPYRCSPSLPFVGVNGLRAFRAWLRNATSALPPSGPMPGCVMMSMWSIPCRPPWFCAAIMSILGRRMERICDFGGSLPPVKPSTRMTAPGGAIAFSTFSISSGSSGKASICSRVSTVEKAAPCGSSAAACLSRDTLSCWSIFAIGSTSDRRVSPFRTRTSRRTTDWKPGNSACTV
jgi:hypothetical protein